MKKALILIIPILILHSCASYKTKIDSNAEDWENNFPTNEYPLDHTVYLIGDAGNSKLGEKSKGLQLLEKKLKTAPENSHVLFLGDNVYPGGLPPEAVIKGYELANHRLDAQINILNDYKGYPVFIPGNHDWYNYGLSGIQTQEDTIEKRINVMRGKPADDDEDWENYFLPDNGCSGPEVIEINKQLVIMVIDSQWWLTDWDKEPVINDGCESKSRKAFVFNFGEILKKHKSKNVIIAMHHPPYTYGPHGGYYSAKQHLFPLTDVSKNLYIPLPGIGSIFAFLRGTLGSKQDAVHPEYKELKNEILNWAKIYGNFIFVSGHEHNMQYIEEDRQHFIVSGAGSKNAPVGLGKGSDFAFSNRVEQGFAQIDFYKDGSAWLQYWSTDADNPEGKVVFRKKIKDRLPISGIKKEFDFSEYEEGKDTVKKYILGEKIEEKGWMHNFFIGKHYRTLYTFEYDMPSLDLTEFKGGMEPIKRGGGNQTNSVRLLNTPKDQQWVMRAMKKDASRLIPYPFNQIKVSQYLVEDNYLSTHPFAAFAIPYLSDAVGIYHTNPGLYYIPKQPALDQMNEDHGGAAYLVEERPAKDWQDQSSFGNSKKIISTSDVVDKLLKSHKHRIDQSFTYRSRLMDLVIGDWDRHADQWRWASFKQNGQKVYRPIPRDRDQPFARYDGLLTRLVSITSPLMKQLKVYKPKIKNIKWVTYSARAFDRTFLNELSWKQWQAEVKYFQENLTDEVIDAAFKTWPKKVYEETGEELAGFVKYRRDHLMETAEKHYKFVSKKVDVFGTNKREKFKVERLNKDETLVTVYNNKKGKENDTIVYQRLFYTSETKEIRLFGLNGKDKFEITGEVKDGPLIRIIGGLDEDEFEDESKVNGLSKKTIIYDSKDGNDLKKKSGETRDKRSNIRENNIYNQKDYHYEFDYLIPIPLIAFNPDDGLMIGANLLFTHYGFKKDPYASTHRVIGKFAFATLAFNLEYQGDFIHAFGKTDFLLDAKYQAPQYVVNYFGIGNDTENPIRDRSQFDYNRVRQRLAAIKPMVKKRFAGDHGRFMIGPLGEAVEIEKTAGRFITEESGEDESIFDPKYYVGGEIGLEYANSDNNLIPTRGFKFNASMAVKSDVENRDMTHYPIIAEMTVYQNLDPRANLVFATRIGTQHNIGNFEFFQAAVLGGKNSLRGFRSERFSGRTSFYQNLDLRWKMFNSHNRVVPFSFGIAGGFDYGRVWNNGEKSSTWHTAYGGGVWLAPVDFFILYFELFRSDEGNRFVFKAGYAF